MQDGPNQALQKHKSCHNLTMMLLTKYTYFIICSYSLSFPFDSCHLLNIIDASTFAGENVFGSFNNEITLRRIVLHEERRSSITLV